MALFENFPYTNLHELNLDWLIKELKQMQEQTVLSVNGQTGDVILYTQATVQFPEVSEDHWSIIRLSDGTTRGILFGNDDKAYIVHGGLMAQVYAQNNPPPYPVSSVNGLTGDVVLYSQQYVELPALTGASLQSWTLFRKLNGTDIGIDFDDNGDVSIIYGLNRYKLYSENNPPFEDIHGGITFDAFTDPNYDGWILQRVVNGTVIGLTLNSDGTLDFKVGNDTYTVYTSNDGIFIDPTDSILEIKEDATNYSSWGLVRETANGKVGIVFDDTDPDAPVPYMIYVDSNNQAQSAQLLTIDDIPAGAGVVTINGLYGIVTLYASDINMGSSDNRTIPDAIEDVEQIIAIVEKTNTATHNITSGQYVYWNNGLYVASQNIAIGDTLSSSNLTTSNTNVFDEINRLNSNLTNLVKSKEVTQTTTSAGVIDPSVNSNYTIIGVKLLGNISIPFKNVNNEWRIKCMYYDNMASIANIPVTVVVKYIEQ